VLPENAAKQRCTKLDISGAEKEPLADVGEALDERQCHGSKQQDLSVLERVNDTFSCGVCPSRKKVWDRAESCNGNADEDITGVSSSNIKRKRSKGEEEGSDEKPSGRARRAGPVKRVKGTIRQLLERGREGEQYGRRIGESGGSSTTSVHAGEARLAFEAAIGTEGKYMYVHWQLRVSEM
jgi:hypothetical protein